MTLVRRCPTFPCMFHPTKIIGIGQNYRAHALEMGKGLPEEPLMFLKPRSALVGDGTAIARPSGFARVDYEGELGVVIGQRAPRRPRPRARARDGILLRERRHGARSAAEGRTVDA